MKNSVFYLNIHDIKAIDNLKVLFPKRFENAQKFKFEDDKLRSLSAGYLLAKELKINENEIYFNEYGKPFVKNKPYFNLSHSGDYAVLAVSDAPIGVDIEKINPSHLDVAPRVLTKEELLYIEENPNERFWILWTLKEAVVKTIGKGMSIDLKSFSVLPIINSKAISIENATLYGASFIQDEYAISVVFEKNELPVFKKSGVYPEYL